MRAAEGCCVCDLAKAPGAPGYFACCVCESGKNTVYALGCHLLVDGLIKLVFISLLDFGENLAEFTLKGLFLQSSLKYVC